MDNIEKALKTWYPIDHELHFNPLHPAIKLAGEAGELLDLYGKHRFKPGFDWWDCKRCNRPKIRGECLGGCVLLVLDELGDWWYYFRIICYLAKVEIGKSRDWPTGYDYWPLEKLLAIMAQNSCVVLNDHLDDRIIDISRLKVLWGCLQSILTILRCSLDDLTEMNYRKLNSEPTNHGWRDA